MAYVFYDASARVKVDWAGDESINVSSYKSSPQNQFLKSSNTMII